MLALTKRAGYGLIAATHLAKLAGAEVASARKIAERFGMPTALLMNVLKDMASAGIIESVRGSRGGYRLAKPSAEINLAGIITALDGPIRLAACVTGRTGDEARDTCKLMATCPIVDPVHKVHRKIEDLLRQMTLSDILDPPAPPAEKDPHALRKGRAGR